MEIVGLSTTDVATKYDIKPITLRKAIQRGEFPVTTVAGRSVVNDKLPQFQDWLARYQKRIAAMRAPNEETTARQQYHRRYYLEHIKPRRHAMRQAAQTV